MLTHAEWQPKLPRKSDSAASEKLLPRYAARQPETTRGTVPFSRAGETQALFGSPARMENCPSPGTSGVFGPDGIIKASESIDNNRLNGEEHHRYLDNQQVQRLGNNSQRDDEGCGAGRRVRGLEQNH